MSPEHYDDETKELDAPGPLGPWAHKNQFDCLHLVNCKQICTLQKIAYESF